MANQRNEDGYEDEHEDEHEEEHEQVRPKKERRKSYRRKSFRRKSKVKPVTVIKVPSQPNRSKLDYFYGPYKLDQNFENNKCMKFEDNMNLKISRPLVDTKWGNLGELILNKNSKSFQR